MNNIKQKKVIISVVSDLVTDQRVNRSALSLHKSGYDVILIGRKMRRSLPLGDRPYKTKRFSLWFEAGPLFYASFNLRLFIYLLSNKADIYLSNDLDTLLANFIASKIKNVKLVYDSHEYFTEVPELVRRPFVRAIWLRIEKWIFPKLKRVMTVNDSIANIYTAKYNVPLMAIRNLPARSSHSNKIVQRKEWNIPEQAKVFLFQGAGINIDRGAEEAIEAVSLVSRAVLLFLGSGDVIDVLKKKVDERKMNDKVIFIPKQPLEELIGFTRMADFGLSLDKDSNLNYKYSLPNKLFDYIQAGLPILATDLTEVRKIVEGYDIGLISSSCDPRILSNHMQTMISDENRFDSWKKNLNIAANELCWEKEEQKFLALFA